VSHEALQEQGYHRSLFSGFANDSHEKLDFSTGGGFKKSSDTIGFQDQETISFWTLSQWSDQLPSCEQNGLGFIWLPGSLPFLVRDPSKCHLNRDEENKFYASRVTQNVPFFRNNFIVIPGTPAEPFPGSSVIDVLPPSDPAAEPVDVPEVLSAEPAVEPSIDLGMPSDPASVEHEILAPPPFDHNLTHFQKLSTCDACNRARLYSKRVKSRRVVNEDLDLAEPEAFGQQLSCDQLIVFKSSRGKEHAVLIVLDRFSKVLQAYPTISREASRLASNLNSYTIVRSDAAGETLKAVIENNWLPESSVPSRVPRNSVLEREMRTFQEIARSLFLQAGFAARPQLWPQACSYVATAMSAFLKESEGKTRWELAFGKEFLGPHYLLGHLGFVRPKMQESSSSARMQTLLMAIGLWNGVRRCFAICFVLPPS